MENEAVKAELYDYRKYDRVWKRVAPDLNPYPDVRAEAETQEAVPNGELCCTAEGTGDVAARLAEFIDGELSDRCAYLTYARCAPGYAKRRLQQMAAEEERHARRLMTVYYLTTGQCYKPAVPACQMPGMPWCPLLRQLYQQENDSARRYERELAKMEDTCLREIFSELAADERCHARQILQLLEKTTLA